MQNHHSAAMQHVRCYDSHALYRRENDVIDTQVKSWYDAFSRERQRQTAVDRSGALAMQDHEELDFIVDLIHNHYRTRYAAISIIDGQSQVILVQRGLDTASIPRRAAFCAVTIQHAGQPLIVPDTRIAPRFRDLDSVTADPFIRLYAGMPITDGAGMSLGAICVADTKAHTVTFDQRLLVMMARETERVLASGKLVRQSSLGV